MIKKLDHLVITTDNIDKCLEFYEKLGFVSKVQGARYELYAGDFKINVHSKGKELQPHARNVQMGSADLCFEIDSCITQLKEELQEKGLEIELGIVERNGVKGPMKSIYLRDPDGSLIEFCMYE